MSEDPKTGLEETVIHLDLATEAPPPETPPPETGGAGGEPRDTEGGLPDDCPVIPLGVDRGRFYYLDDKLQLREYGHRDHQRLGILDLFGHQWHRLMDTWPRLDREGNAVGWRPERAAEELMAAAKRAGIWNARERVRGAGAWRGEADELILHCGDLIWRGPAPALTGPAHATAGEWLPPGMIGRYVYPAAEAGPRFCPAAAAGGPGGPAERVLDLLRTWNWRRGETDARLLLGWIGAAMVGGALDWRSAAWITGGTGHGKSTLLKLVTRIFAGDLVSVSDASAAGIWQKLGYATLPVAIDELEAEEDNRRSSAVIKLARQAASGGLVLRGGADHSGAEFVARSCFLFSSVLIPPLLGQDRSRLAILELGELAGSKPPALEPEHLAALGAQLRRRLADHWSRFGHVLEAYRAALIERKHNARGADQFGTLLACADVLLHNAMPDSDSLDALAEALAADSLGEAEDTGRDEERCRDYLLTSSIDPFRSGARRTIGDWLWQAAGKGGFNTDVAEANKVLGTYGLKVIGPAGDQWVCIAHYHKGLSEIYAGSQWAGRSGSLGGWVQPWRRLDGAGGTRDPIWFSGGSGRAVKVPLASVMPGDGPPRETAGTPATMDF